MFFYCGGMVVCSLGWHYCGLKDIFKMWFRFQRNQNSTLQHSKIWTGLLMKKYRFVIIFSTLYDACTMTLSGMIMSNPLKLTSTEFKMDSICTLYLYSCMDARSDDLLKTWINYYSVMRLEFYNSQVAAILQKIIFGFALFFCLFV